MSYQVTNPVKKALRLTCKKDIIKKICVQVDSKKTDPHNHNDETFEETFEYKMLTNALS